MIPIIKLKDFLIWRQKEFVEKYESVRRETKNDVHSILEANEDDGNRLVAAINTDILNWDNKASHPWILSVEIKYNGKKDTGMPEKETLKILNEIEETISKHLKNTDGFLNIGRQTSNNLRIIYFACHDFRFPSKVLHEIEKDYKSKLEMSYEIYKDKYWRTFNRFNSNYL